MAFNLLQRLIRGTLTPPPMDALYRAVVATARDPRWYTAGAVPDTLDGRFDMVVAVLSVVLLRLEREPGAEAATVALTERFVADMDGSLRQIGVGDLVVGKHVGRMVGALGGRLGAYRAAFDGSEPLDEALVRNLYRGTPPAADALTWIDAALRQFKQQVEGLPLDRLLAGEMA